MIEKLFLRGIITGSKKLITKMKLALVKYEHPYSKCEVTKKYFFPKLLTASD